MSENKKDRNGCVKARVGVFICDCGSNIAGHLDCSDVAEYAATFFRDSSHSARPNYRVRFRCAKTLN